jgi:hypothetical protein
LIILFFYSPILSLTSIVFIVNPVFVRHMHKYLPVILDKQGLSRARTLAENGSAVFVRSKLTQSNRESM